MEIGNSRALGRKFSKFTEKQKQQRSPQSAQSQDASVHPGPSGPSPASLTQFFECPWFPLYPSILWKLLLPDSTWALPALSFYSTSYPYSRFKIIDLIFQLPNADWEEGNPSEQMRSQSTCCLSVTDDNEQRRELNLQTLLYSESYIGLRSQKSVSISSPAGRLERQQSSGTHSCPFAQVVIHISETYDIWASLLIIPYILPSFCGYGLGTS